MKLLTLTILGSFFFMFIPHVSAKIVFTSNRDGTRNLYVMDDDGRNVKKITHNNKEDVISTQPRWSPNGKYIAFLRIWGKFGIDQEYDVFLMNADGSNQQRLTHHPAMDGGYLTWSPDSQYIAFTSYRKKNGNIHTIDILTQNVEQLTDYKKGQRERAQEPDWSPDGKRIAYVVGSRFIYIMDADGENQQLFLDGGTFIREPLWSSDGKRIMYSEHTFGKVGDVIEVVKSRVVIVDLHAGEVREKVMPAGWGVSSKSWMGPQKALLAIHTSETNTDIFVWDFTSDTLKNLTDTPGVDWTPDWIDDAALDVSFMKKKITQWGQLKIEEESP